MARVTAANVVPPMLAPSPSTNENELEYVTREHKKGSVLENADENKNKPEPTSDRLNELFSKLDLTGIQEWSDDLQQQVHNLIVEYQHFFALNDLELGKMSKVKHEIKLSNPVPFKDRYRCIPPYEFNKFHNHLRDMLKLGAIRKSVSPWASLVVLV